MKAVSPASPQICGVYNLVATSLTRSQNLLKALSKLFNPKRGGLVNAFSKNGKVHQMKLLKTIIKSLAFE